MLTSPETLSGFPALFFTHRSWDGYSVQRSQIATLKGDMEREKAEIGLFVTLNAPTRPMLQEAASAGVYVPELYENHRYPRVQILTVEDLLAGVEAQYPRYAPDATFRRAPRRREGARSRLE